MCVFAFIAVSGLFSNSDITVCNFCPCVHLSVCRTRELCRDGL